MNHSLCVFADKTYPDWQDKVRKEAQNSELGNDISKSMPIAKMVALETLRLAI